MTVLYMYILYQILITSDHVLVTDSPPQPHPVITYGPFWKRPRLMITWLVEPLVVFRVKISITFSGRYLATKNRDLSKEFETQSKLVQTNKETNKQTKNKETNKQTNKQTFLTTKRYTTRKARQSTMQLVTNVSP